MHLCKQKNLYTDLTYDPIQCSKMQFYYNYTFQLLDSIQLFELSIAVNVYLRQDKTGNYKRV
jgi:hypothetical protein